MTDDKRTPPYLRSVVLHAGHTPLSPEQLGPTAWQRSLFVSSNVGLLVFANVEILSEAEFLELITEARAKYVLDLRPAPRFDVGSLTRRQVFSIFEEVGSKYLDLSGRLGVTDRRDSKLNPQLLTEYLASVIQPIPQALIEGPLMFLVDTRQFQSDYVDALATALQVLRRSGWELLRVPERKPDLTSRSARIDSQKTLVFISHANPEDNEFARWLGIQLTLAGYQIWSDVTKLIGGETIWNSVEDAIRYHSAKVLVVVSRASQHKNGVLDEINLAISIERAAGNDDFVLPIRLDTIPFDEMRANIARKHFVDFSTNWATGLDTILATLSRDGVPRVGVNADSVAAWYRRFLPKTEKVARVSELLCSNWLDIHSLPEYFELVGGDAHLESNEISPRAIFSECTALLCKRSPRDDRTLATRVRVDDALRQGLNSPCQMSSRQASNLITHLLRQSWAQYASKKGLIAYTLSSGAVAWYLPVGLVDGDNVVFRSHAGKSRRKFLVGRSEKRNVYWHFALEARPTLAHRSRIALISHVAFTHDGKTELVSQTRSHTLRRQFCKNWWNDRWRDLTIAYLTWFFGANRTVNVPGDEYEGFLLSTRPIEFRSPVSTSQASRDSRIEEAVEELEWEDLDVIEATDEDADDEIGPVQGYE